MASCTKLRKLYLFVVCDSFLAAHLSRVYAVFVRSNSLLFFAN